MSFVVNSTEALKIRVRLTFYDIARIDECIKYGIASHESYVCNILYYC